MIGVCEELDENSSRSLLQCIHSVLNAQFTVGRAFYFANWLYPPVTLWEVV